MPASPNTSHRKHAFTVWLMILAICISGLVATYLFFVEAPPPRRIVIATGPKEGAYFQFALKYAKQLEDDGITLKLIDTKGSVENLELLLNPDSEVSVAIIQSGVAKPEDRGKLVALGSLYREPLWLFLNVKSASGVGRVRDLDDKRIGVGPPGSGTHAVAMQILAANAMVDADGLKATGKTSLVKDSVAEAAKKLSKGELDAAFFVAGWETNYIQDLTKDPNVWLLDFKMHEAYHRKFRFLSQVTVPAGLFNLGEVDPLGDVHLLAPTAMLVARKDVHPALVSLLLTTATRIHGRGDELTNPGEFPSAQFTDIPVSDDAKHFYKSGPPVLQRLLPFWLASLADRLKVMLIPLIMLLMPLIRAAPPLVRWRTRRKIYLWYSALREIDKKVAMGLSGMAVDSEIARLRDIEHQVAFVEVPLSYMEEFYHLRLHLTTMMQTLEKLRAT